MISIIICSKSTTLNSQLTKNIETTVGVIYELIIIDNSEGKFNINQAYNVGAAKAGFSYLCFIHEDVLFDSKDWGNLIIQMFEKNANLGLIGLAGSICKSENITGWTTGLNKFDRVNIMHGDSFKGKLSPYYINPENKNHEHVLLIDGVFMAVPAKIFETIKFDDKLSGFNFYDIEYSIRIKEHGLETVVCLKEIRVIHNSLGKFNNRWIEDAIGYHQLNKERFKKLSKHNLPEFKNYSVSSKTFWLQRLNDGKFKFSNKIKLVRDYGFVFNLKYLFYLFKFLVK